LSGALADSVSLPMLVSLMLVVAAGLVSRFVGLCAYKMS
jgi:hypothetical protein